MFYFSYDNNIYFLNCFLLPYIINHRQNKNTERCGAAPLTERSEMRKKCEAHLFVLGRKI